jgi:ribosomal protein S18 acetylase RimI-like enzyme
VTAHVEELADPDERSRVAEEILRALPEWFGLPAATDAYIRTTARLETLVAGSVAEPLGFLALEQHTPYASEIHVMGVRRDHHRRGIGRALVGAALDVLRARGIEFLQVKTLGPSHPSRAYAATRSFYEAVGFRPLEELRNVWSESNPCLIMVRRVDIPLPKR